MVCPEYEDLLVDYGALDGVQREHLDAHLEHCMGCSAYLALLSGMDEGFGDAFAGMQVPVGFRRALSEKLSLEAKPSFVPEVLDLVAGVALIAVVGLVLGSVVNETCLLRTVAVMLFVLCVSIGLLSYAELRESE
jgi:hypothetical protein